MKSDASSSRRRGGADGLVGFAAGALSWADNSVSFFFDQMTAWFAKAFAHRSARRGFGNWQVSFMLPVSVAMFESIAFSIVPDFSPIVGATTWIVAGAVT